MATSERHQRFITPSAMAVIFMAYPDGESEARKSSETKARLGEVVPCGNGDGVFTGREPHNTHESNEPET